MLNPSVSLSQPVFDVYAPRLLTGRAGVIYMWRRGDTAITFPIQITMILLMSMLGRLPMRWFERAGNIFGGVVYLFSRRDARRLRENLRAAGVAANEREYRKLLYEAIGQTGKTAAEWVKVWFGAEVEIERLIVECKGWPSVEEARRDRKAIIFLMPHLGSFQLAMRFIAQRMPLTALYRPPQVRWLEPLMMAGSQRAKLSLAPTNLKGVERLIQALRRGEAVALPPDQAPNSRGGVWAEFFGRPAYTTTLPRKLQRATGAVMFTAFAAACRAVKLSLRGPTGAERSFRRARDQSSRRSARAPLPRPVPVELQPLQSSAASARIDRRSMKIASFQKFKSVSGSGVDC